MSEVQTSQSNGSAPPAATTQRKARSLADLVEEQVKGGHLDPTELEKPVQWRSNFGSRSGGGGDGFGSAGGRRWNNPGRGDANGGYQRQHKDNSSLNWQQKELLGNNRDGGNAHQGGYNNRRPQGQSRGGANQGLRSDRGQWMKQQGRGKPADLPEWATDLDTSAQDNSSLNWQQKSLLSRDESNPFNRLVRGEDEYNHE